jgi:hypothetical protein
MMHGPEAIGMPITGIGRWITLLDMRVAGGAHG